MGGWPCTDLLYINFVCKSAVIIQVSCQFGAGRQVKSQAECFPHEKSFCRVFSSLSLNIITWLASHFKNESQGLQREMIGSIGVMVFAYVGEKSNCAAEICWDVLLESLPGCSDLECIQLVRHLCYQRCISSAFNSIPALSGSCLILLPEIASGGKKKRTANRGIVWNIGSKHRWWWWLVPFLAS